jgi:dihydroorotase
MLAQKELPPANVVVRGARVVDPTEGIDTTLDVRIDAGVIAAIGDRLDTNEHRVIDGGELVLAPAFVDPHVHLRTPGREDEETIASGTAAAAAGGYCAILAMPNTDPVVDSAATLGSLVETAKRDALVPTGFLAAITCGQRGEELTEMGELADAGALAFSDDGVPVASAGMLRRALQYAGTTGRPLALHCEEPSLTRGAHMHAGAVSAELGLGGYPSVGESVMVERDLALAANEEQPLHLLHLSAAESVAALRRAREHGVRASGEVTPHHLVLTDEAVRSLDPNVKMNPPLRAEPDRLALVDALRDGTIEAVATDHAPHARHEKDAPFEAAPFGVTGLETAFAALYTELVLPGLLELGTLVERMTAGAALFELPTPAIAAGEPANLVLCDLEQTWEVGEAGYESRSENCCFAGRTLTGRVVMTVAAGSVVYRERSFALSAAP